MYFLQTYLFESFDIYWVFDDVIIVSDQLHGNWLVERPTLKKITNPLT